MDADHELDETDHHHHPRNRLQVVFGRRLKPGETIAHGDVYSASSGFWKPALCYGHKVRADLTWVWVRPSQEQADTAAQPDTAMAVIERALREPMPSEAISDKGR